jgi:Tfp pilus assembly protein FimT
MIELLIVVGLIGVISAIAIPMTSNSLKDSRIRGDVRTLNNTVSLAKMRAASKASQVRVFFDLNGLTYRMETYQSAGPSWTSEGADLYLSTGVTPGFSSLTAAPPNTTASLAQAPQCRTAAGVAIGNTACVVFNTRGIPVDSTGSPTALGTLYLTDGTNVFGVTVAATGLIQLWNSQSNSATWAKQ